MGRLPAGLLALTFLVSGCAGPGTHASSSTGTGPADGIPDILPEDAIAESAALPRGEANPHPGSGIPSENRIARAHLAYAGPLRINRTYEGPVAPQQACPIILCVSDDVSKVIVDLSDAIPVGVQVQVGFTLGMLDGPGGREIFGGGNASVDYPKEDRFSRWTVNRTATGIDGGFTILRYSGGPVRLLAYRDAPASANDAYRLDVQSEVATERFDETVPLGLKVDPSATALVIASARNPNATVRVWDPHDRFLGDRGLEKGTVSLPVASAAGGGEYVLQVNGTNDPVRFYVLQAAGAPPPVLRVLGYTRTHGTPHDVMGLAPVSWTFQSPTVPFGVGVSVGSSASMYNALFGRIQVFGPAGARVLEGHFSCTCSPPYPEFETYGSSGLQNGTYTATYTHTKSEALQLSESGLQLSDFVDSYRR
jgi:hypothetical protein